MRTFYLFQIKEGVLKNYKNNYEELYNLLESIRISAILLEAFIPSTSEKILNMLNTKKTSFDTLDFGTLETDIILNESEILFNRIETK